MSEATDLSVSAVESGRAVAFNGLAIGRDLSLPDLERAAGVLGMKVEASGPAALFIDISDRHHLWVSFLAGRLTACSLSLNHALGRTSDAEEVAALGLFEPIGRRLSANKTEFRCLTGIDDHTGFAFLMLRPP